MYEKIKKINFNNIGTVYFNNKTYVMTDLFEKTKMSILGIRVKLKTK